MVQFLQKLMSLVIRTRCRSAYQSIFFTDWTESIFALVTWAAKPWKPELTSFFAQSSLDATQLSDTPRISSATWTRWRRFPSSQARSSHEFGKWKSHSPVTTQTQESYPPLALKSRARKSFSPRRDMENSCWIWKFIQLLALVLSTGKKISQ